MKEYEGYALIDLIAVSAIKETKYYSDFIFKVCGLTDLLPQELTKTFVYSDDEYNEFVGLEGVEKVDPPVHKVLTVSVSPFEGMFQVQIEDMIDKESDIDDVFIYDPAAYKFLRDKMTEPPVYMSVKELEGSSDIEAAKHWLEGLPTKENTERGEDVPDWLLELSSPKYVEEAKATIKSMDEYCEKLVEKDPDTGEDMAVKESKDQSYNDYVEKWISGIETGDLIELGGPNLTVSSELREPLVKKDPETGEVMVRGIRPIYLKYKGLSAILQMPGWYSIRNGSHSKEDLKVYDDAIAELKKRWEEANKNEKR